MGKTLRREVAGFYSNLCNCPKAESGRRSKPIRLIHDLTADSGSPLDLSHEAAHIRVHNQLCERREVEFYL